VTNADRKLEEIVQIHLTMALAGEYDTAYNLAISRRWADLVLDYPDLTAEEIASGICGGGRA
jgi:hypothetical protein